MAALQYKSSILKLIKGTGSMAAPLLSFVALVLFVSIFSSLAGCHGVGVNYGLLGNNLPPPAEVVSLLKSRNISTIRLFEPNQDVLKALEGSGIEVILGTLNGDLPRLASDPSFATQWVMTNIAPYTKSINFRYVTAGNEVIPGQFANDVIPAMQKLDVALTAANLEIPVTTVVATGVLGSSFPPSQGAFSDAARPIMAPLIAFLASKNTHLLVNVYPYFAYASNTNQVRLDYALFTATDVVVQDGSLGYRNLFDAIVDTMYSAMEKVGGSSVEIVVSETGWPSGGGAVGATVENAKVYNNNAVQHVDSNAGTPKRPGKAIETYLFALFNENQKPAGTEQNFGLYQPDKTEVYHVSLP